MGKKQQSGIQTEMKAETELNEKLTTPANSPKLELALDNCKEMMD